MAAWSDELRMNTVALYLIYWKLIMAVTCFYFEQFKIKLFLFVIQTDRGGVQGARFARTVQTRSRVPGWHQGQLNERAGFFL